MRADGSDTRAQTMSIANAERKRVVIQKNCSHSCPFSRKCKRKLSLPRTKRTFSTFKQLNYQNESNFSSSARLQRYENSLQIFVYFLTDFAGFLHLSLSPPYSPFPFFIALKTLWRCFWLMFVFSHLNVASFFGRTFSLSGGERRNIGGELHRCVHGHLHALRVLGLNTTSPHF